MGKMNSYKGNLYVEGILNSNQINRKEMKAILDFFALHENVYLFGKGACGNGFWEYCHTCNFSNLKGFVTSDSLEDFYKIYVSDKVGIILTLKDDYYPEIMPLISGKIAENDILLLSEATKNIFVKTFSRGYLEENMWITLPVAKHCNVNCASCNMFSPICEQEMYTLEEIERDIKKLKEIKVKLSKINITGGEPFLNPEIVGILEFIRKQFDNLRIEVYSNVLPAINLTEEELNRIRDVSAVFMVTDYGIGEDVLKKVLKAFDNHNIKYNINCDGDDKLFFKKTIDLKKRVPLYEYINCQYYTFCFDPIMFNGNLYKCPLALNAKNISKYFNKKIEINENDYLPLDDVDSPQTIYDYWRHRLSMCSYCPPVNQSVNWHKSERKIEEWI